VDEVEVTVSASEKHPLTVSELTRVIRGLLESQPMLAGIWVRGETSNVKLSPTGHLFFTLKDENAELPCVFFGFRREHRQQLADGVEILAFGDIGVYEKKGTYQLVVRDFIVRGEGELAQRFEMLKRKLAGEGLFDEEHKLPIPALPRRVGIVTSREAAALTDVVRVLSCRAPYLRAILFPALVQGKKAPPSIISALKRAEGSGLVEVILLVRGGGSLEDLWCFNDEKLARVIYGLKIPLISGIGHEIDFTIADFVADRRAPTPSAAAELVAPDIVALRKNLSNASQQLAGATLNRLRLALTGFRTVKAERFAASVVERLSRYDEALGGDAHTLARIARQWLQAAKHAVEEQAVRLSPRRVLGRVRDGMAALDSSAEMLIAGAKRALGVRLQSVQLAQAKLAAIDPEATLSRGYALVWDEEQTRILRSIEEAPVGSGIVAELTDGYLRARVSKSSTKGDSKGERRGGSE